MCGWVSGWVGACIRRALVNTIQTEPLQLGPSNLVHILLITRGRHLLLFKVGMKAQGHTLDIVVKPCKYNTDSIVWVKTVKYNSCNGKRTAPFAFQGKCQGKLWLPCKGMHA